MHDLSLAKKLSTCATVAQLYSGL